MVLLPELFGFARPGEKSTKDEILICDKCNAKRTVHKGKYVPLCSRCKEQTYWYKVVTMNEAPK